MINSLDSARIETSTRPLVFEPAPLGEVVEVLSEILGPNWRVEQQVDSDGAFSIIALATTDMDAWPALLLYEHAGAFCVATVKGDEWGSHHLYLSRQLAVEAFAREAGASGINRPAI